MCAGLAGREADGDGDPAVLQAGRGRHRVHLLCQGGRTVGPEQTGVEGSGL